MPGWFDIPSLENLEEVSVKNSELRVDQTNVKRQHIIVFLAPKVALEMTIHVCPLQSSKSTQRAQIILNPIVGDFNTVS